MRQARECIVKDILEFTFVKATAAVYFIVRKVTMWQFLLKRKPV